MDKISPEISPAAEFKNKESDEKRKKIEKFVVLAKELSREQKGFSFPGIDPGSYLELKASEEEFPGFATPIDELSERLKSEGMKVVLGRDPNSGNVFILPQRSNNIEKDSIFPKHLQIIEGMDKRLKELILLSKS